MTHRDIEQRALLLDVLEQRCFQLQLTDAPTSPYGINVNLLHPSHPWRWKPFMERR